MNSRTILNKQTDRQNRFITVQILRIIACLGVFLVHFGQRVNLTGGIRTITDFGRYGVQLFLIICGFLAAKGILDRKISYGRYLLKRAIRILPLYYLSILWFFITESILNGYLHQIPFDDKGLYWLRYIFLLNGFVNSDTYFWSNLGITWTIPLFVWFYLIIPLVLTKLKGIKQASIASIGIAVITIIANHFYSCNVLSYFWIFFLRVISYCAVKFLMSIEFSAAFQVIALVFFVIGRDDYGYCFLFAGILLAFVSIETRIHLPQRINNIINYIDEHTYTLYLVHGIVFCSLIDRLNIEYWQKGILAVLLSVIGTLLVYRFYEKPIQKWLTNKIVLK